MMMELTSLYERGIKMSFVGVSTFELIDRINGTVTWADEEVDPCMRELCDRYHIDFNAYNDYETLWDSITDKVYEDVVIQCQYMINDHEYAIIYLDSDVCTCYAVVNGADHNYMFDVYESGTMQECKEYIKECVDNYD